MTAAALNQRWIKTHCCDRRVRVTADRHYPRQTPGSPRFVGPGSPLVFAIFRDDIAVAYWVSLLQQHIDHAWPGTWQCSAFRNESGLRSSELISEALAATRFEWGAPPLAGLVTFVDAEATESHRSPWHKPGHCFRRAGFREVGRTDNGKVALLLSCDDMPSPVPPLYPQLDLFAEAA